jgi:ferrous-iron efflux pump FieF
LSAETVIFVALASVILVVLVSLYVGKASKNYGLSALGVGGFTGWIDVSSSFAVVIGAALSKYFGILHADAVAGVIIAGAIFVGAYSIFKEASLVLVDACNCGDVICGIGDVAKSVSGIKEVHSIRMRKVGSYLVGDMHIVVDGDMPLKEADEIATKVEEKIKSEFGKILEVKVRIESDIAHDRHSEEFTIKKD